MIKKKYKTKKSLYNFSKNKGDIILPSEKMMNVDNLAYAITGVIKTIKVKDSYKDKYDFISKVTTVESMHNFMLQHSVGKD